MERLLTAVQLPHLDKQSGGCSVTGDTNSPRFFHSSAASSASDNDVCGKVVGETVNYSSADHLKA